MIPDKIPSGDLKAILISAILDMTPEERKRLLAMWKERQQ